MGQCFSCRKSKARFRDKSNKICGQIQYAVSPLHTSHEENPTQLNGHVPTHLGASPRLSLGQSMATAFPNMNITNPIKGLVSKRRNRYKKDGFNLDLTYITPNIIAMGYPASNIEGVYRNHIDDVIKFLDSKHRDHYYIYNLCSERGYDSSKFHNRVLVCPFDDHNPPKIELIRPFCDHVRDWLARDARNVAAVHCKAGKGRTGTMICCYLLHSKMFTTAEDALNYYGRVRTQDKKGVTIPSQVRYVNYYAKIIRENLAYRTFYVYIREIVLEPVPEGQICFHVSQQFLNDGDKRRQKCVKLHKSGVYEVKRGTTSFVMPFDLCLPLAGDIKIEFFHKKIRKEKQFQFWFNTFFVEKVPDGGVNGCVDNQGVNGDTYVLRLCKKELDIVNKKDKQNKMFSADFQVTLYLHKVPTDERGASGWPRETSNLLIENPSESSETEETTEDDTNEEDEWDSGESTYL